MNPVTCWKCGVWCCDLAQRNKNLERNKIQNDKKKMRFTPFWDVVWWVVVHWDVLGKCITPSFRGQAVQLKMPHQWVYRDCVNCYWEAGNLC